MLKSPLTCLTKWQVWKYPDSIQSYHVINTIHPFHNGHERHHRRVASPN